MRAFAIVLGLIVLAIASFFAWQHSWPLHRPQAKAPKIRRHRLPQDLVTQTFASNTHATATSNQAPQGFFLGKGDERIFLNYGTPDPVLRSFLKSVMESGDGPNAEGKQIYLKICAACHQPDGGGKEGVAPPLAGAEWALGNTGERMVRIVLSGLAGPIKVQGKEWNLSMPPWRENLDDDQVAVVLTYIRSELPGNHARAISPEFVAEIRKEARLTPETAPQLLQISD